MIRANRVKQKIVPLEKVVMHGFLPLISMLHQLKEVHR